jgi:surface polysaccharide O-acyltransferase-like enzyme
MQEKRRAQVSKFVLWHASVHRTFLVASWVAPFFIMATGYFFFPALRAQITLPLQMTSGISAGISVQLTSLIVWLGRHRGHYDGEGRRRESARPQEQ